MTKFDFDSPVDRRGTQCVKWDTNCNPEVIPMWVADMDFRTAPAITEALERRAAHGVFGYAHPGKEYYDAITGWFQRRHEWTIDPEHIIYTTGVVPAVSACVKALAKPGEKVLIMTPVYTCFFSSIRNNGCLVDECPLVRTEDAYAIDFEDFERHCADPLVTVFILCNPHNPCARVWTVDELRRIDEICTKYGVTVVSDEIHCEIVFKPHKFTSYGTVARGRWVACTSPSKAFNTAGLHAANIIAPDKEMRTAIDRAININEICDIGPFGIEGLMAAYDHGAEWLDAATAYIHNNYLYLKEHIEAIPGANFHVLNLEGTYLAWVDVSSLDIPVAWLCDRLEHDNLVRFSPGTAYGAAGEGYLRVNLACPRAQLEEAIRRTAAGVEAILD